MLRLFGLHDRNLWRALPRHQRPEYLRQHRTHFLMIQARDPIFFRVVAHQGWKDGSCTNFRLRAL